MEAILQIEVASKDMETTCMKLGYGLMEQLEYTVGWGRKVRQGRTWLDVVRGVTIM